MASALDSFQWFFTAPTSPPMVRRGDPLGLRLAATRYAEALVPGLSNRTTDLRWLAIASWMITKAYEAWPHRPADLSVGLTREQSRGLFNWILPLELLWIARTLTSGKQGARQLPGQRAIGKWLTDPKPRFNMTAGQYSRQRFIGIYGAYRVALRSMPGLTVNSDGWRPDKISEDLAVVVQGQLGSAKAVSADAHGNMLPITYWCDNGWSKWKTNLACSYLPQSRTSNQPLSSDEVRLLDPPLFGGGILNKGALRRSQVIAVLRASNAKTHREICVALEAKLNAKFSNELAGLGAFAGLADAGYEVMNSVWNTFSDKKAFGPAQSCAALVKVSEVKDSLAELVRAAKAWQKEGNQRRTPDFHLAHSLADIAATQSGERLLSKLLAYHIGNGGGQQWFELTSKGEVSRASPTSSQEGSPYRYRLYALARLAVQAKKLSSVPAPLLADPDEETGE